MNYSSETWYAVLAATIFDACEQKTLEKCPGCAAKLKNSILHQHHQMSLLDKIREHFDEVRGTVLRTIPTIYDKVASKLPHSPDLVKDKEIYCNNATIFLSSTHPDALYWGRYVDEHNDDVIVELIKPKPTKKRVRQRQVKHGKKPSRTSPLEQLVDELLS